MSEISATDSSESSGGASREALRFVREPGEVRPWYRRVSPRAVIYPVILLLVCFLMTKNRELGERAAQEAERERQTETLQRVVLDATKPSSIGPAAAAPVFPQLMFCYEDVLPEMSVVERLREKYSRDCTVQPVDLRRHEGVRQQFPGMTAPFAVFSRPDGSEIKIQGIPSYEFFDAMLSRMLPGVSGAQEPPKP